MVVCGGAAIFLSTHNQTNTAWQRYFDPLKSVADNRAYQWYKEVCGVYGCTAVQQYRVEIERKKPAEHRHSCSFSRDRTTAAYTTGCGFHSGSMSEGREAWTSSSYSCLLLLLSLFALNGKAPVGIETAAHTWQGVQFLLLFSGSLAGLE